MIRRYFLIVPDNYRIRWKKIAYDSSITIEENLTPSYHTCGKFCCFFNSTRPAIVSNSTRSAAALRLDAFDRCTPRTRWAITGRSTTCNRYFESLETFWLRQTQHEIFIFSILSCGAYARCSICKHTHTRVHIRTRTASHAHPQSASVSLSLASSTFTSLSSSTSIKTDARPVETEGQNAK